jgi:steroid delta-isomerase-like uncharacterized protein
MKTIRRISAVISLITTGTMILLFFPGCRKINVLEKNKAVIRNALDSIWNHGNLDEADLFFADDYVYHGVSEIHGAEGIKQHVAALRASVPDFHVSLEDMIAEGDKVVCRWTGGGTQLGEFMGIPPSGKQIKLTGIIISRISDGKIIEEWETSDQLGLLQLLGVIPMMPDAPMSVLKREKPEDFLWSKPSTLTGNPGNPEKNRTIISREEEEVWNQRNLKTFETLYSPGFINHDPGSPDVRTWEEFKQFWMMVGEITQDYRVTIDDMIAEGDKVAVRWSSHFIEKTTAKPINNKGIVLYRLADGKIVESWFSTDMLGFMRQLGILPSPAN